MSEQSEIDELIAMLDHRMGDDGVARLKVVMNEEQEEGTMKEKYHHGRCDVGSAWAKGKVPNFNTVDHCD